LISVTRLRIRSYRYLPPFVWYSVRSAWQARRAGGFLGGKLMGDGRRTYWTTTAWVDEAAMRAYRNSGAHFTAMRKLLDWCDEASYTHWVQDSAELPDIKEAHRRVRDEGRLSKVRNPSPAHAAGQTAEPESGLRFGRAFSPAR
jgi:hypothetical protein